MAKRKLEEGFYEAHLRDDEVLFCYVHETELSLVAELPSGETWPVHPTTSVWPYILEDNLTPVNPAKYREKAKQLLEFISKHSNPKPNKLEIEASAQSQPSCKDESPQFQHPNLKKGPGPTPDKKYG
ncbi:hypothetical protein HYW76_05345 [Candidatus Pacearchaeota archaeon]|nr:hypothetical protein [Candidatus Pacearchaeota archaeon]